MSPPEGRGRQPHSGPVEAVVWQGSGTAWPGVGWGEPAAQLLARLGWRVSLVAWGDPAFEHRGRRGVLHLFAGGLEPVCSGTAAMADRLDAVRQALGAAADGDTPVVGVCLGAQQIAAVAADLHPEPARPGELGVVAVHGHGAPDLHVPTAHVQQVPARLLAVPGARLLWSNAATPVQGFGLGERVVGVQFHPELSEAEAGWAAAAFARSHDVPPASPATGPVDPAAAVSAVLDAVGATRLAGALVG